MPGPGQAGRERAQVQASSGREPIVAEEDMLRARCYGLLAALLSLPPDAATLAVAAALEGDSSTALGRAFRALAARARETVPEAAKVEFDALFLAPRADVLLPYASYYRTGSLAAEPLALLRADLATLGIAPADMLDVPEDHIAALAEVMAGLAGGAWGPQNDLVAQRRFFEAHLADWGPRFFAELAEARDARLYRAVARVGQAFLAVEDEGFRLAA